MRQATFAGVLGTMLLLTAGGARAAGPLVETELFRTPLSLGVDEIKTLKFDVPIGRIDFETTGVVQAVPRSDQTVRIKGLSTGRTPVTISSPDGKTVFEGMITVTSDPGHLVRIYRPPTREEMKAAGNGTGKVDASDEYWCTPMVCNDASRVSATNR